VIAMLSQKGKKVAMISRGYRRASTGTVVVSNGTAVLEPVGRSGDEPLQIARKFRDAVVIADERRARAARLAVSEFKAEVIVLDDGFQHRALHRDLDIVMLDDSRRFRRLLPAGLMREPFSSLRRADLLVRTSEQPASTEAARRHTKAPIVEARRKAAGLVRADGSAGGGLSMLKGTPCLAFCGIGNPESFRRMLEDLGASLAEWVVYPDHHPYSKQDLSDIARRMEQRSAVMAVTTEKDAARLSAVAPAEAPALYRRCYVLGITMEIVSGAEILAQSVERALRRAA
jgi:tetraacyldisaccharide 4'-kinase